MNNPRPTRKLPQHSQPNLLSFLPSTPEEMKARGWAQLDFLIINGDAYVDHPSFGAAIVGRSVEAAGFRVGIISQPRWDNVEDFLALGRPRLAVGITAGNLDSMLNKLTAQKKVRSDDFYSPGGRPGARPNRASVVYSNLARQAFPGLPVVLGGIEASLRRIAHYDYWSDSIRRSVLLDAKADLLVFGMAEAPLAELLRRLDAGETIAQIRNLRGSAFVMNRGQWENLELSKTIKDGLPVRLPSYEEVAQDKAAFAKMTLEFQLETNPGNARPLIQPHGTQAVYYNPPAFALTGPQLDALYNLPYVRAPHWSYKEPVPAWETVKHSLVAVRGCFGGCSFCSITEHEGRKVQSRSAESLVKELGAVAKSGDFKGVISDVGGPTSNMYALHCREERIENACRRLSCVHPEICKNLVTDHRPLLDLLKTLGSNKAVRHLFVASGIRYDLARRSPEFIRELARSYTGGQLSVAPEHISPKVLSAMRKPRIENFEAFTAQFQNASEEAGKEQHLIPYFISGHPGCSLEDMIELALYLKSKGIRPRQVQDFIPTPMSVATAMYYTGIDPMNGQALYVARDLREKKLQKSLLLYWDPEQWPLAREALHKAGRLDLIGKGPQHLIPVRT